MPPDLPALPPAYELVWVERVDSVVAEAVRRARRGAGEGTLVWAREQTGARTPSGKRWHAPPGNLHCALVIQPEYDNATAQQLLYVATVSAGNAIADIVSAMTGLRWRWPGRLFINDLRSGVVELATPGNASDPYPWLVLGVSVNVAEHPPNPEPERYNSLHDSGAPEATVEALLEGFSRHFLSWINRWADEGFEPVRRAWTLRADGVGEPLTIALGGETVAGTLTEIDPRGDAVLSLEDGRGRSVGVAEFFRSANGARGDG